MTIRTNDGSAGAEFGILLVDENRIFAEVLALRLSEEPQVGSVTVAGSVAEARPILSDFPADLILVDSGTSDDLIRQLMAELPSLTDARPAVVVLSGLSDTRVVVKALQSGVRGWVTKDSTFGTLWGAMREVMEGHMVLSPSVVEPVMRRLLEALRQQEPLDERDFVEELSPREYEVLRCLVAGMNRKEIAARLYLSINTVRTHVQHLLRHADEHTTIALVASARRLGVPSFDDAGPARDLTPARSGRPRP